MELRDENPMWPWKNTTRRIWLYRTLATSLDAGLGMDQSLELTGVHSWAGSDAGLLRALSQNHRIPEQEARILSAAEAAGALPEVLQQLAGLLEARVDARRRLMVRLLYPVLLLHAAVLLPNLRWWILGEFSDFSTRVVPAIVMIWVLGGVVALALVRCHTLIRSKAGVATALRRVPVLGPLIQGAGASTYARLFSILLAAGAPLGAALRDSATCCGNAELEASGLRIKDRVTDQGDTLSAAFFAERRVWPLLLIEAVRTGEAAGRLEETLAGTARGLRQEADRRTERLLTTVPIVVYLAVAGYVAWVVITTFTGIYRAL